VPVDLGEPPFAYLGSWKLGEQEQLDLTWLERARRYGLSNTECTRACVCMCVPLSQVTGDGDEEDDRIGPGDQGSEKGLRNET